jgi:hypothetical protein
MSSDEHQQQHQHQQQSHSPQTTTAFFLEALVMLIRGQAGA